MKNFTSKDTVANRFEHAFNLAARRDKLRKCQVTCPACEEQENVQLRTWVDIPAEWKCQVCNYRWQHEPELD